MAPIVCVGGGGKIWVCSLFYRAVLSVLSNFAIIFDGEKRAVYLTLSYDVASGSEITPCNKISIKTTSGLSIYGKRYDVHNNVAYIMTKL